MILPNLEQTEAGSIHSGTTVGLWEVDRLRRAVDSRALQSPLLPTPCPALHPNVTIACSLLPPLHPGGHQGLLCL